MRTGSWWPNDQLTIWMPGSGEMKMVTWSGPAQTPKKDNLSALFAEEINLGKNHSRDQTAGCDYQLGPLRQGPLWLHLTMNDGWMKKLTQCIKKFHTKPCMFTVPQWQHTTFSLDKSKSLNLSIKWKWSLSYPPVISKDSRRTSADIWVLFTSSAATLGTDRWGAGKSTVFLRHSKTFLSKSWSTCPCLVFLMFVLFVVVLFCFDIF